MGLRDSLKKRIKSRVSAESLSGKESRERQGQPRRKERAAQLRARAKALGGGGERSRERDDMRTQAARAEEVATMTAPVKARLDPIDIPDPFQGQQRGNDNATMEDLVLGSAMAHEEDESEGLFDDDDSSDSLFGGL